MADQHVIAIDLGASNGRVLQVSFDGARFSWREARRFANIPVEAQGTLYWDALLLWREITDGLACVTDDTAAIGIDGWGVDFALLDQDGHLVGNPVHYRDRRTEGMYDWVFERVPRRVIFERTGIQFMSLNTLYQFASLVANDSSLLDAAHTILSFPNLLTYWLTGARVYEFTQATTSQCFSPHTDDWDIETLAALGIPTDKFADVVMPGAQIGTYNDIPVILPACHDTGSAVVAVPATTSACAFLSSGTWSVIGVEVDEPVINDAAYEANVTNEGGVYGTYRLLKNVMGLWLEQQCRVMWEAEGLSFNYASLIEQALAAEPFRSVINPDDPGFLPPGDMPARIRAYCRRTNQPQPETVGQMLRAIYESLALKYRRVLDTLATLTGKPVETVHIIGGGSQNTLLCQMAADATGRVVVAGPVEATALGNAVVQFITLGEIGNLAQARELLRRTLDTQTYEPQHISRWDAPYAQLDRLSSLDGGSF